MSVRPSSFQHCNNKELSSRTRTFTSGGLPHNPVVIPLSVLSPRLILVLGDVLFAIESPNGGVKGVVSGPDACHGTGNSIEDEEENKL